MTTTERQTPPDAVRAALKRWREGFDSFPESYIKWHLCLAEGVLRTLKEEGWTVRSRELTSDGWGDGMRSLHVALSKGDRLVNLCWHDGNQEFFEYHPEGGSSPFRKDR